MNNFKLLIIASIIIGIIIAAQFFNKKQQGNIVQKNDQINKTNENPLSITAMRKKSYPGSDFVIEETISTGGLYDEYIASYKSDGLKILGLLTVPTGDKPKNGWPVIIFNHGYIPPDQYRTTERYVAYIDAFARNGYIVFKSDYRGNGSSEGQPEGAYYSPAYATDILNAVSSLKKYKDANPEKLGMWGHSMGGNITFRDIIVNTKDIKAAVIWGGVVGSYDDLMNNWQRRVSYQPPQRELAQRNNYRKKLTDNYGTPQSNPEFWNTIDPTYFLSDINIPIQLQTGGNDEEVPVNFSATLYNKLKLLGKNVEYHNYPGDDHNISNNLNTALQRSVEFFNKYLKGGE